MSVFRSWLVRYGVFFVLLLGLVLAVSAYAAYLSLYPAVPPQTHNNPSALEQTYSNPSLGISFRYPTGYYILEDTARNRLNIQNVNQELSGIPDADFRNLEIRYGASAAIESDTSNLPDSQEQDIKATGGTIYFYTYPHPKNTAWTIGEAFWFSKIPFSASFLWNRVDGTSQAEGDREREELALLKEILPTIVITPPGSTSLPPIQETTYQTSGGLRYADRDTYQKQLHLAKTTEDATTVLRDFLGEYEVTIITTSRSTGAIPATTEITSITWEYLTNSNLSDLKTFGAWFIDEWSKYPKAWVKVSNVHTVAMIKNLAKFGTPLWAEALPFQTLFLQVTPLSSLGSVGESYLRRAIHHEFGHEIEFGANGSPDNPDSTWSSFNPTAFKYGQTTRGPNAVHPDPGFVTGYSETTIGEDKAEVYSYLFKSTESKTLASWIKSDSHLAAKVAYYKSFIRTQVPIMDDAYFRAINP